MAISSRLLVATLALGLSVAASTVMARASADAAPAPASSSMGHIDQGMMQGNMHDKMHRMSNGSMHMMPATVTSVDTSTGKVEVNAGGMALTVHFPPKSVANLKVGDKITLHMGYTK